MSKPWQKKKHPKRSLDHDRRLSAGFDVVAYHLHYGGADANTDRIAHDGVLISDCTRRDYHCHPFGPDDRRLRDRSSRSARWHAPTKNEQIVYGNGVLNRCGGCWPNSGPMTSKLSSYRAVAMNSYAPSPKITYGVPPQQVIGSSGKLKFETRKGELVLIKLPGIDFTNDKFGKPAAIQEHIGLARSRRLAIRTVTWRCCDGRGPESVRALACSSATLMQPGSGPAKGLAVVDMKRDWRPASPFE